MTAEDSETSEAPVSTGRDLAARALVAGANCTQQRAGELLETSRRSVGRAVETDLMAALQNPAVVTEARTVLAASVRRASTDDERAAAESWLAGVRDEHPREPAVRRPSVRRSTKTTSTRLVRSKNGSRPAVSPRPPVLPIAQLDALERQQQRILHRTQVIDYILVAEQRNGATLTLGEAVAEFLQDISEAARTIGTILRPSKPGALH